MLVKQGLLRNFSLKRSNYKISFEPLFAGIIEGKKTKNKNIPQLRQYLTIKPIQRNK
jgi:hypothetical protein